MTHRINSLYLSIHKAGKEEAAHSLIGSMQPFLWPLSHLHQQCPARLLVAATQSTACSLLELILAGTRYCCIHTEACLHRPRAPLPPAIRVSRVHHSSVWRSFSFRAGFRQADGEIFRHSTGRVRGRQIAQDNRRAETNSLLWKQHPTLLTTHRSLLTAHCSLCLLSFLLTLLTAHQTPLLQSHCRALVLVHRLLPL